MTLTLLTGSRSADCGGTGGAPESFSNDFAVTIRSNHGFGPSKNFRLRRALFTKKHIRFLHLIGAGPRGTDRQSSTTRTVYNDNLYHKLTARAHT